MRRDLVFNLSQSLFSSFDIDQGSRLLLKSIEGSIDPESRGCVMDIGCGVGVLGISVLSSCPHMHLSGTDRDALAASVSRENAVINRTNHCSFIGALGTGDLAEGKWDLILANLPAKAGAPVLSSLIADIDICLHHSGTAAVVIVKPLEALVEQAVLKRGAPIIRREPGNRHTVFHFRKSGSEAESRDPTAEPLAPYLRNQLAFRLEKTDYPLRTVYNLPEFDTIGYASRVAAGLSVKAAIEGGLLIWNPGQGHLAAALLREHRGSVTRWLLAGRDILPLLITRRNLAEAGVFSEAIDLVHCPIFDLSGITADTVVCFPDEDPGVDGPATLPNQIDKVLVPGGYAIVVARSTYISRMATVPKGFLRISDRHQRGYRGILLQKRPGSPNGA